MKLTYDPRAGRGYITISAGKEPVTHEKLRDGIELDVAADGSVVGVYLNQRVLAGVQD